MVMESIQTLFTTAYRLQQDRQFPKAISLYEQILATHPDHAQSLQALGLIYAQLTDMENAIRYFNEALRFESDNPSLYNNLGNALKKRQRLDDAVVAYQHALRIAPDYAQAHNNLAGVFALQGEYQRALNHYRQALHAQPDFVAAHFDLGVLLLKYHALEAAQKQFNNVVALDPTHSEAVFYLGVLALESNQLTEAEAAFQTVLSHHPEHVQALTNLGVVALKQDQGQLAVDYFTKALTFDNQHVDARNNLAATFMHHDRFENALMHYDVLLQVDPNNLEYLYNTAVAQMALGHLSQAVEHFETLLTLNQTHFATLVNLAAIYVRLARRDQAILFLQRALRVEPHDASAQFMLNALQGGRHITEASKDYVINLFNNYALYYDNHLNQHLGYSLPQQIIHALHRLELPRPLQEQASDKQGILSDATAITDDSVRHNQTLWEAHKVAKTLDLGCGTGLTGAVLRENAAWLVGVDIAPKMLAQAKEKLLYDALVEDDILHFLDHDPTLYNWIIAADVVPYFGDLEPLFQRVKARLAPQGLFVLSCEISLDEAWKLQETARFCHRSDYLHALGAQYGYTLLCEKKETARLQNKQPLEVLLFIFQNG